MAHPHHEKPNPTPEEIQSHARAARARKRAEAAALGIDEGFISRLVDTFYGHIRADSLLGPIFAQRIADWEPHLAQMKRFWRSILLSSGEYTGNPMAKHVAISGLEQAHFVHWLELFYATLRELEGDPAASGEVGMRARMIADSLLTGIAMQSSGMAAARAGDNLPRI